MYKIHDENYCIMFVYLLNVCGYVQHYHREGMFKCCAFTLGI